MLKNVLRKFSLPLKYIQPFLSLSPSLYCFAFPPLTAVLGSAFGGSRDMKDEAVTGSSAVQWECPEAFPSDKHQGSRSAAQAAPYVTPNTRAEK